MAAGDIADCTLDGDTRTAELVEATDATVLTLGDNAYESGSPRDYADCYGPTWGKFLDRTRPAPGNHEYQTEGATGYFDYYGRRAGPGRRGYYSFDLVSWHLVSLDSNCDQIRGGCRRGSPQERWLRADLAANRRRCTLAFYHHPRFSSGSEHGSDERLAAIWRTLHEGGVDVVLSGHDHSYERFAPLGPDGDIDPLRGITQFVVGTGGRDLRGFGRPVRGSEVRRSIHGVLRMTLRDRGFDWRFVPVRGQSFHDAGSGGCH